MGANMKKNIGIRRIIGVMCALVLFACSIYILGDGRHISIVFTTLTVIGFSGVCILSLLCENRKLFWSAALLIAAFLLRLIFLSVWQISLTSDALTKFTLAHQLAHSPLSQWRGLVGATEYGAEWSVHLPHVLFQTVILKLGGGSAESIHYFDALLSSLTVLLTYHVAGKIFDYDRRAALAGLLMLFNPTSVMMTGFMTNQHAATCLLMLGIWLYMVRPVRAKYVSELLCGAAFAASHLMRPEMQVVIIAVACLAAYDMLDLKAAIRNGSSHSFETSSKHIWEIFICAALIVAVFFALTTVSGLVLTRFIGAAPPDSALLYKVTVGLNQESLGRYNYADYVLASDKEALRGLLAERLAANPLSLISLMIRKVLFQFSSYDYWNLHYDLNGTLILGGRLQQMAATHAFYPVTQGYAFLLMIFAGICLCRKSNPAPLLHSVIFMGFVLTFAIIEVQQRYNYLMLPFFSIWAAEGVTRTLLADRINTLKRIGANKVVQILIYALMICMAIFGLPIA